MSSLTPINRSNSTNNFHSDKNKNPSLEYMNIRRSNKNILYQNLKKLENFKTFDNINIKETDWKRDIKDYEKEKKILKWGFNSPVKHFTNLYVSSGNRVFHPITQKYLDKNKEEKLFRKEKTDLINHIAKCYDNSLRINRTYDIINLQDKFKVFANDPNYPKSPRVRCKKINNLTPKINYNILSNLNYKIHHFDRPEKRPNINLVKKNLNGYSNIKGRNRIINTKNFKDFNILNNNYHENDKEKKKIDSEISSLISAKKFFELNKSNPLTGIYYDDDIEKCFQDKKELIAKKLLKKKADSFYNPINSKIYDEEKCKQKELLTSNIKVRYKIKNLLDQYYHLRNQSLEEKYLNSLKYKLSYNRYKQEDERRYNILNNKEILNLKKDEQNSNDKTPWRLIKEGCNEHETLTKSQNLIIRDKDDIFRTYADAKIKREKEINILPKLENDSLFQLGKNKKKIIFKGPKKIRKTNSFVLDKKEWFNSKMSNDNDIYFLKTKKIKGIFNGLK